MTRSRRRSELRDPSHVRNYTDAEWREHWTRRGLGIDDVRFFAHPSTSRPGSSGPGAPATTPCVSSSLLGDRIENDRLTLDKIAIKARKGF